MSLDSGYLVEDSFLIHVGDCLQRLTVVIPKYYAYTVQDIFIFIMMTFLGHCTHQGPWGNSQTLWSVWKWGRAPTQVIKLLKIM